jgi:hypothetical protein
MRAVVLALVATALALPAPARAADIEPTGLVCNLDAQEDPRDRSGDTFTGVIDGGPIAGNGTLTCTFQRESTHGTTANDEFVTSGSGDGVVALATPFTFQRRYYEVVYLCSQWDPAGGGDTLYYDNVWGEFTTDPNTPCAPYPSDYSCACPEEHLVDDLTCPVIETARVVASDPDGLLYVEPGGDVYAGGRLVWDCWPYRG